MPESLLLGESQSKNLRYFLANRGLPLMLNKVYSTELFFIPERLLERDKQNFIQAPLSVNTVK